VEVETRGEVSEEIRETMRAIIREFGEELVRAFREWLDANRDRINPRWVARLERELRRVNTSTVPGVVGGALWMFNVLGSLGVVAGVGLDGYTVFDYSVFDRRTTDRLLARISIALHLQLIPRELGS
jgi:hypothetical protein